jgi:hypothetical protein
MELVPKAEFSIVTRASQAWIPELITAAGEIQGVSRLLMTLRLSAQFRARSTSRPDPDHCKAAIAETRDRSNIANSFPTRRDSGALRRISRSYRELPLAEVRSANASRTGE